MANELTLPAGFGPLPAAFAGDTGSNDDLGAGVASSYAVVGYRGKVWSIKYQGDEKQLMREDGDGPRNSIEVILVKSSPAISKIFYRAGYVEGSNAAPDCWSANGQVPDGSVLNKVSPTCATCPMNAWGSRVTEAGKQNKACADSRRVAVVPLNDIHNELFGGPMLLRIPAASLKDLKAYGTLLDSHGFKYYAAATRVSFDPAEAFPKMVFTALRSLTNEEASLIKELREDPRTRTVLNEDLAAAQAAATAAATVASSPFGQPVGGAAPADDGQAKPKEAEKPKETAKPMADPFATKPQTAQPTQAATETAAPAKTETTSVVEVESGGDAPDSFEDLLDSIL